MEETGVQRLARVLKLLVTATLICNLLVLPLVPGMVWMVQLRGLPYVTFSPLIYVKALTAVWGTPYGAVLTAFLLFCGGCTAVLLWQGRRVLGTILAGRPFCMGNARSLRRAAGCCLLVSAAALARTVWGLFFYGTAMPLFTYNALFVPVFFMGGLLCLVMSALFRQAAELKAESDLTI